MTPEIGAVIIGRNEGERLRRCLHSVLGHVQAAVYVDSGSTDGSVALAAALGAHVLELDLSQPFTAARARNAGWRHLCDRVPTLRHLQFVDGDCELREGWWAEATAFLQAHPEVAVVCGRRRERHPQASVYNRLCDIEWDTPLGPAAACGGDAMMRVEALRGVGGYRDSLIAGEEPELCVRLRAAGWTVWRLDAEMTWHDAAITRFSQWWQRARRAGHAFAEGAALHGRTPFRHYVAESRRAMLWGVVLPVLAVAGSLVSPALAWVVLAYPLQAARLGWRLSARAQPMPWTQAAFLVLARFPEGLGWGAYWWNRLQRRRSGLIEYK